MYCSHCGHKLHTEAKICDNCGTPFDLNDVLLFNETIPNDVKELAESEQKEIVISADPVVTEFNEHDRAMPKGRRSLRLPCRKTIQTIGISVLVIVVAALLIMFAISNGHNTAKYSNHILYLKDNEVIYNDFSKNGEFEITTRFINGESVDKNTLAWAAAACGDAVAISSEGNRIFFPDKVDADDLVDANGFTLYYRDLDKRDKEASKIDSGIIRYAFNRNGTVVVYLKNGNGDLYIHDLIEKQKIATKVDCFYCTEDLKKIFYSDEEGRLYLRNEDEDTVKLASGVSDIVYLADDLSMVYYIKNDALYKQSTDGGDREKIASDVVADMIVALDSGKLYYAVEFATEIATWDYVDDNLATSDALISEPQMPDYPDEPTMPSSWYYYRTTEEYNAAKAQYRIDYEDYKETYNRMRDEYATAYDAYREKCTRDTLRENLRGATLSYNRDTLYYYDGYKSEIVSENMVDVVTFSWTAPVMVVRTYSASENQRVKLSEISSVNEAKSLIEKCLLSTAEYQIVVDSSMFALKEDNLRWVTISPDGRSVVYTPDNSSESDRAHGGYDFYEISIEDGQLGIVELIDTGVDGYSFVDDTDRVIYYKDEKNSSVGDLYFNGEVIDYDAYRWGSSSVDDAIVYYIDWNSDQNQGTLRLYKDGEKTTIADDVCDYVVADNGDILYLSDYSTKYYTGILYRYRSGKSEKIADDVTGVIKLSGIPYHAWY